MSGFVPVASARSTMISVPGGIELRIPSSRNWFVVFFLALWLCGWVFGEFNVVRELQHPAENAPVAFMRLTPPTRPCAASSFCHDQWNVSRRKSEPLFIVIASLLPSRLFAVMLPIETAGSGTFAGKPPLTRWRVIQPMPLPPPPTPNSRFDCASKWLRTIGFGCTWPAPTTNAACPA